MGSRAEEVGSRLDALAVRPYLPHHSPDLDGIGEEDGLEELGVVGVVSAQVDGFHLGVGGVDGGFEEGGVERVVRAGENEEDVAHGEGS